MLGKFVKSTLFLIRYKEPFFGIRRNFWAQSSVLRIPQEFSSANQNEHIGRSVPLTGDEFKNLKSLKPSQPENPYLLKVSILGEPNAGKSTLTNSLVKWKVCAVSRKVHTTRKKAAAILVEESRQIVFLDTPGFVTPETTKKHALEPAFIMDPLKSIREADLIAVVVDISNKWTNNRINPEILKVLYDFKEKKSILILNKVDAMKSKSRLLSLTRILTDGESQMKGNSDDLSPEEILKDANAHCLNPHKVNSDFYETVDKKRGWPLFSKVFMVSALKNDGVEDLRNYLLNEAKPNNWMYNENIVTDQHPHEIALTTVREKLLEYLPNEIPYTLQLKVKKWEMLSTGCPKIDIQIKCTNSRHRSFVIGPDGKHIAACVEKSRRSLRESFRRDVVLNLAVI